MENGQPADVPSPEDTPDQMEDTGEEYDVEAIVDTKLKNGKRFYLVKWDGYPESEKTWEPEHHLRNVRHLIRRYLRDTPAK